MAELPSANMEELDVIESIASSDADTSVLMINLNRYAPDRSGQLYKDYMAKLHELVDQVNGKVLWRTTDRSENFKSWYLVSPLPELMSIMENMRLRKLAIEMAVVHRSDDCTG